MEPPFLLAVTIRQFLLCFNPPENGFPPSTPCTLAPPTFGFSQGSFSNLKMEWKSSPLFFREIVHRFSFSQSFSTSFPARTFAATANLGSNLILPSSRDAAFLTRTSFLPSPRHLDGRRRHLIESSPAPFLTLSYLYRTKSVSCPPGYPRRQNSLRRDSFFFCRRP